MKLEFITFIRKYANRFVEYLDSLATKEIQKIWHKEYRNRMERKTNAQIVTKGKI
jgi:hypothetical protein